MTNEATPEPDVTYVATLYPIVAHIQDPARIDRTLCGQRVRYWVRLEDSERRQMSICYTCQRKHAGEEDAA